MSHRPPVRLLLAACVALLTACSEPHPHHPGPPPPPPEAEIVAWFTFAGRGLDVGMTCEETQVERMDIRVGSLFFSVPCSADGLDGAVLEGLEPGTYDVTMSAFDRSGRLLYESLFRSLKVMRGSNDYTFNLLPVEGAGLSFTWRFAGRDGCASAGVSMISYQLVDAGGAEVYSETIPCLNGSGPTGSVVFAHDVPTSELEAGLYMLSYIEGWGASGSVLFETTAQTLFAPAGRTQGFGVTLLRR